MYIEHDVMASYDKIYAACEKYVDRMIRMRFYHGVIRMSNDDDSLCVTEACVKHLENKYGTGVFSKVDIDYMSDSDGCYIIITLRV